MPRTQPDYHGLLPCIANALQALSDDEPRMVRDAALDALLERISRSLHWRQRLPGNPQIPSVALRSREYLRAHATGGRHDCDCSTAAWRFYCWSRCGYRCSAEAALTQWVWLAGASPQAWYQNVDETTCPDGWHR